MDGGAETITRGSDNVFADLSYADAGEHQTKFRLAHAINGVRARGRLTQAAAAAKPGLNQPESCRFFWRTTSGTASRSSG